MHPISVLYLHQENTVKTTSTFTQNYKLESYVEISLFEKFLDAGIQDVSTSILIVHDLIEISPDDGDESDKHI